MAKSSIWLIYVYTASWLLRRRKSIIYNRTLIKANQSKICSQHFAMALWSLYKRKHLCHKYDKERKCQPCFIVCQSDPFIWRPVPSPTLIRELESRLFEAHLANNDSSPSRAISITNGSTYSIASALIAVFESPVFCSVMALFIGNALAKSGILQLGEAEAAFHPWWETLQDYTCYTAIIISKTSLSIDCLNSQWHHNVSWSPGLFAVPKADQDMTCAQLYPKTTTSPAPGAYVNGYCTREYSSLFVRFLPYVMVLGPFVLVVVDKFSFK